MEESCAGVLSKYDYVQCARQDMTKKERKKNLEAPSKAEQNAYVMDNPELSKSGALRGLGICVSGVFEDITREKLEYFIK